ncbi:MAG: hypothetical protein ABIT83_24635 [Massilia sp.]
MNGPLQREAKVTLYNHTACRDTGQYFCNSRPFSVPRSGNKVKAFRSGKEVLKCIHDELLKAEHFIWIADWQMGFDVELVGRGEKEHSGQLHKM